jgi:hypothetical protein
MRSEHGVDLACDVVERAAHGRLAGGDLVPGV